MPRQKLPKELEARARNIDLQKRLEGRHKAYSWMYKMRDDAILLHLGNGSVHPLQETTREKVISEFIKAKWLNEKDTCACEILLLLFIFLFFLNLLMIAVYYASLDYYPGPKKGFKRSITDF